MRNKCKYLFLLVILYLLASRANAQELSLAGTIDGKHAVHMFLDIKNNKAEALYFYDRIGMPIYLEGGIGTGKFVIGNAAEQFSGMIHDKNVTGMWMDKRKQLTLPFALTQAGFEASAGPTPAASRSASVSEVPQSTASRRFSQ